MAISDNKITEFVNLHANNPDRPALSAEEIKAFLDSSPEELRVALNGLIDGLLAITDGNSGLDNIGGTAIPDLTGTTGQAIIESLKTYVDNLDSSQGTALANHIAERITHGTAGNIVGETDVQILTNKTINAGNNTISDLEVDNLKSGVLDTDLTSVSANDDTIPSAKATKTYIDSQAPLTIPNDSITEQKMASDMKKDITGGVASYGLIENSFNADLESYYGNTKLADDFQDVSLWTVGAGTQSTDTTNVKIGSYSLKLLENDALAGDLYTRQSNVNYDLGVLSNGEASVDSDYVCLLAYVSDINALNMGVGGIRLAFDQATSVDGINAKTIDLTSGLSTGWNYVKILKSSFTTTGSGAWSGIQSVELRVRTNAGYQNEYVNFQLIQLIKKDPSSAVPNPYQRNGVADFNYTSGEYFVGFEFGQLILKQIGTLNSSDDLIGTKTYDNCIMTAEITTEATATENKALTYYVDSSNFIECLITSDTLRLRKVEASVITDVTTSFAIDLNDKVKYILIKNGTNVNLKVYKNNDLSTITALTQTTTLNGGKLALGALNTSYLYSSSVTEISHAYHSDVAEIAKSLTDQARARVYNTANQSIPDATETRLIWNTVDFDNREHFDVNQNDELQIRETGLYYVKGAVSFAVNSTGFRYIRLYNSTNAIAGTRLDANSSGTQTAIECSTIVLLTKGQIVNARVYQNSGGALNSSYTAIFTPVLELVKIS